MPTIHHLWRSMIDFINGGLSVSDMNLFFHQSWLLWGSTVMKLWGGGAYSGRPSSTPNCQSQLSCATMWSWQVSVVTASMNEDANAVESKENVKMLDVYTHTVKPWGFLFPFIPFPPFSPLSAAGCESVSAEQKEVLLWLFRPPLQAEPLSEKPNLTEGSGEKLVEIGPRYDCTLAVW